MEGPARMLREPFAHFRVFVSGVVVNDRIDHLSLGKMRVDVIEKADELLMPVALHVATDDGAVENVEGGEQGGCAVAFVVVGHRPGAARLHRQSRLGAVEGLDLALLVDRENDGVGGRIDVEADDVPELRGELRVVRQLERPEPALALARGLMSCDRGRRAGAEARRPTGRSTAAFPVGRPLAPEYAAKFDTSAP